MDNVRISVIIPLFNKEKTVLRAINSVLHQTILPSEIIIINDGSTDQSLLQLQKISDSKIRVFNQENGGVSNARNKGIQVATSEYIAFLDADDEWLPEFLFTIIELIQTCPEAIGFGTSYFKKFENNSIKRNELRKVKFNSTSGIIENYFEVCTNSDPPIWTSAVCIKKAKLLEIGGFPVGVKAGEDLLTWAKLSQKGNFAYSTTPRSIYYQPTFTQILHSPAKKDIVGNEFKKMLNTINPVSEKNNFKKYIAKWHKMRAALFLITGVNKSAIREILNYIKFGGFSFKIIIYLLLILFPKRLRYRILFPPAK